MPQIVASPKYKKTLLNNIICLNLSVMNLNNDKILTPLFGLTLLSEASVNCVIILMII